MARKCPSRSAATSVAIQASASAGETSPSATAKLALALSRHTVSASASPRRAAVCGTTASTSRPAQAQVPWQLATDPAAGETVTPRRENRTGDRLVWRVDDGRLPVRLGHDHTTTSPDDAGQLSHGPVGLGQVLEDTIGPATVEAGVGERQPAGIAGHIRTLASSMEGYADLLGPETRWDPEGDPAATAAGVADALDEPERYLPLATNGAEDPLVRELRRQALAAPLRSARTPDELLDALTGFGARQPRLNVGNQANWQQLPDHSSPVTLIRATFDVVRTEIKAALAQARQQVLGDLLGCLRDFVLAYAQERRRMGVATFHDLLAWARDLLRDQPGSDAAPRRGSSRIFVDEFQDTDPLQAEIVFYLAADPEQALRARLARHRARARASCSSSAIRSRASTASVAPTSASTTIYEQRLDRRAGLAGPELPLGRAGCIDWVNHHFAGIWAMTRVQPPYVPWRRTAGAGGGHRRGRVRRLPRRRVDRGRPASPAGERRGPGASPCAARRVHGAVRVLDAGAAARPARYGDICVLMPVAHPPAPAGARLLEEGVPYRIESGKLVLATQEVRDLLACLRAIDDPSDQVALVGALRSPAFGCSDPDLLRGSRRGTAELRAGGRDAGCDGPVARPSGRCSHSTRARSTAPRPTPSSASCASGCWPWPAFGQERPREPWRRLRYLIGQARSVSGAGHPTLRSVLDWLETLRGRAQYDAESPVPEGDEDAVRPMTVHGGKGREFPVVILTGLGAGNPAAVSIDVVADHRTGTLAVRCGALQTSRYDEAREKSIQAAEAMRLLYVAATRASDHLILCLFHGGKECHARRIERGLADTNRGGQMAEPLPRHRVAGRSGRATDGTQAGCGCRCRIKPDRRRRDADLAGGLRRGRRVVARGAARPRRGPRHLGAAPRPAWGTAPPGQPPPEGRRSYCRRKRRTARASRERRAPAAPDESDDNGAVAHPPVDPDVARRLAQAVYATLRHADLETQHDLETVATLHATRYGVPSRAVEVALLSRTAAESDPVREAFSGSRSWRAVPAVLGGRGHHTRRRGRPGFREVGWDAGRGGLRDGRHRRAAGTAGSAHRALRRAGGAYALMLEHATGKRVSLPWPSCPSTGQTRW